LGASDECGEAAFLPGKKPALKSESDHDGEPEGSRYDETHFKEDLGRRGRTMAPRERILPRLVRAGPIQVEPKRRPAVGR
jgi:hypothetical protein